MVVKVVKSGRMTRLGFDMTNQSRPGSELAAATPCSSVQHLCTTSNGYKRVGRDGGTKGGPESAGIPERLRRTQKLLDIDYISI